MSKIFSWLELIIVFIGLPYIIAVYHFPRPILYSILATACIYIILRNLHTIDWRAFLVFPRSKTIWFNVVGRTLILLLLSIIAMLILPNKGWFLLPKYNIWLWLAIMVLYPVISVLPQEIIWRFHLLENTKNILPSRQLRIIVSAVLFGWVHIIFGTVFAVVATIYLGLQLAYAYYQGQKSFWVVWVEHSLAGQIAFTIGLGVYFYNG
ncbi:MAG: type II CAAX prenyl endopeptidase Rce1 family protein [Alphaproteobacteria bacterium]